MKLIITQKMFDNLPEDLKNNYMFEVLDSAIPNPNYLLPLNMKNLVNDVLLNSITFIDSK